MSKPAQRFHQTYLSADLTTLPVTGDTPVMNVAHGLETTSPVVAVWQASHSVGDFYPQTSIPVTAIVVDENTVAVIPPTGTPPQGGWTVVVVG